MRVDLRQFHGLWGATSDKSARLSAARALGLALYQKGPAFYETQCDHLPMVGGIRIN